MASSEVTPPGGDREIRLGRAAFLGAAALGIAGIAIAPRFRGLGGALSSVVTGGGWRIYTVASPMPVFDPATYRLRVTGLVERPADLTWGEVAALPGARQTSDFHCVTGWSVEGVRWEGVRPATLVDLVRPRPGARWVSILSMEEPYADQLSLAQFLLPDVLLARGMDGAPVSREHGAPLRLVIPRMYGYKGVKWVREIRFDAQPALGYWEQRGYDVDAWVGKSNGYSS